MDLIIDYLTYVFIPAYALFGSGLLPGSTGWVRDHRHQPSRASYLFADTRMKTKDYSFSGFPACWNMVVLVLFALEPNFWISLGIVIALAAAMFTPLKFIHPGCDRPLADREAARGVCLDEIRRLGGLGGLRSDVRGASGLLVTSLYLACAGIVSRSSTARTAKAVFRDHGPGGGESPSRIGP